MIALNDNTDYYNYIEKMISDLSNNMTYLFNSLKLNHDLFASFPFFMNYDPVPVLYITPYGYFHDCYKTS